ncbi:MAG: cryptochrome/photolyase family protein [Psychrobacter sp.]|uniref:cryptochrome/photolyase family protein n=1 Tax=unclassified Psychrobacter TaxID=196806 RepID=UPI001788671B|nr:MULTISPECIES: cryptochrome/photolyase family protein [unclassified Psychrobacter]MBE0443201.1 cryptochrome/photolyase family protein [Psychrobacter sp. FME13]
MNKKISLIFPHQLFANTSLWQDECYLIEEDLYFTQYPFHKQKLVLHRASMKAYEQTLINAGKTVHYIESGDEYSDCRKLIASFDSHKHHPDNESAIEKIYWLDLVDDWLRMRVQKAILKADIDFDCSPTPMFLNPLPVYCDFFKNSRLFHHDFYIEARKRENILIDGDQKPIGGQWSFDEDNRKKYPRRKIPPAFEFPELSVHYREAIAYVDNNFSTHYGNTNPDFRYPTTHDEAKNWLEDFLSKRFTDFGQYEDAIVADESILHHSVLTPMLNTGLLTPEQVVTRTLEISEAYDIPINSLEGFIRQIIGWREFMYGLYESIGRKQRSRNFWGFTRKIPPSFYTGDTSIEPIDTTIKKVLNSGYAHHIERLMVFGNFMLLCEFDPDDVYQWFMELFIDAYDWVMVPNIYGMSQFADGGLMATKPYISGSNYINKMSDYQVKSKGEPVEWAATWDGLFWRFMHVHRDFFAKNPRTSMLLTMWDKMGKEQQTEHLMNAEQFLKKLDKEH